MPRLAKSVPKYCKHKSCGQAVVTRHGKDFYLGPHGTQTSKRRIALCPDDRLAHDLLRLQIKESVRGYRLAATRDEHGHCDRAVALSIALPLALEVLEGRHVREDDVPLILQA